MQALEKLLHQLIQLTDALSFTIKKRWILKVLKVKPATRNH